MKTIKNYKVDLASLLVKKTMYDFAKKMRFDVKVPGNKTSRDRTLLKLPKSPAIMVSGLSTFFLPSNPDEKSERSKLISQEKQVENNSNINHHESVAIVDKLLEYKCISTKQLREILMECNLLHTKKK